MVQQKSTSDTVEQRNVAEIFNDPRHGYMVTKAIEAVKDAARIEDVITYYTAAKLLGNGRLLAHCVAPDHEDRTPSMTVYTDSQRFKCFGCGLHGDVVDLERVAGRHVEAWTAVIALADRHGVNLPTRSERWRRWQGEKARRHDELRIWRERRYRRRLYRWFAAASIAAIQDPAERETEARKAWEEVGTLAHQWAVRSLG